MKIPDSVPWRSTGETLGSGGQANVYLVTRRDQPSSTEYALKVLRNVASRQAKERFRREIEVVKGLDHPSIAKIIDHSEPDDPFQYYVMQYYDGACTVDEVIFSGSNPFHGNVLKCLEKFELLVFAIGACEETKPPVVHRDISPKNILLLQDGTIRLIDFGICQIEDGRVLTLVDENLGTRNYSAPECEAGNDLQIGTHSDLYSAAKVLWSMVTSQHAFAREEPAFSSRSMFTLFPANSATWHLSRIFEKTIRANPSDRYQKAEHLLALIREVRYLVEHGYPPLEEVVGRCPSCGQPQLMDFPQGHAVFGNPNPEGVSSVICRACGFGFVRNMDWWRKNMERFRNLR